MVKSEMDIKKTENPLDLNKKCICHKLHYIGINIIYISLLSGGAL